MAVASRLSLIDTSAWLFVLGEHPVEPVKATVQGMIGRHEGATCAPVVFELLRGVAERPQADKLLAHLESLKGLPLDWTAAGRWAAAPGIRKLRVKSMDLLIAHTALVHGATLVHADADFDRLAKAVPLRVESFVDVVRAGENRRDNL